MRGIIKKEVDKERNIRRYTYDNTVISVYQDTEITWETLGRTKIMWLKREHRLSGIYFHSYDRNVHVVY